MISENLVNQLKSDNEHLQIQLEDLNYMIQARVEELEILRKTAAHAVLLQSRLDQNLNELDQMQNLIGEQTQLKEGAFRREASLEEEMFQSIEMEKEYYTIREQFASTKAALTDMNNQMADAVQLYQQLADQKMKVAELESNLEIASLDNQFLKEELDKYRDEAALSTKEPG